MRWLSVALIASVLIWCPLGRTVFGQSGDNPAQIAEIVVEVQQTSSDHRHLKSLAQELILLRPGQPFDADKLQQSLEAMRQSQKFQQIHADAEGPDTALRLHFDLVPFDWIKRIRIRGEYPFFEAEILKLMTIYPGNPYIPEMLDQQRRPIIAFLKKEGYIDPQVNIRADKDPRDGRITITVSLHKGPAYHLTDLQISGNRQVSDLALKAKMKSWRAQVRKGRFVRGDFDFDVQSLIRHYASQGFFDIAIDPEVQVDPISGAVQARLQITEGPAYHIRFEGNAEFWDVTLKKDVVMFTQRISRPLALRKTTAAIESRYRKRGYRDVQVDIKQDPNRHGYLIQIAEGRQSIVRAVSVSGNRALADKAILANVLTRKPSLTHRGALDPEILDQDLAAVKTLYLSNGYAAAEIGKTVTAAKGSKPGVAVQIDISEGRRTIVDTQAFKDLAAVTRDQALAVVSLKPKTPYRAYMLESDANAIAELIAEQGYPHVTVAADATLNADQTRAAVTYTVDTGPYVQMGPVFYAGNFRTRRKLLKRELGIEPQTPFSLRRLLEGQQRLRQLNVFNNVRTKSFGLKEKADQVTVLVDIEEREPYFVQAGGGYVSDKGFNAHLKIGDINWLGSNRTIWLAGQISETGYGAKIGIREPRLLGTPIAANWDLFTDRSEDFNQNFGTTAWGSDLGLDWQIRKSLRSSINFGFQRRRQFLLDGTQPPADDVEIYAARSIGVATPAIVYDTRDSIVRPRKGWRLALNVDISKGFENSLDDFVKLRLDTRFFYTPVAFATRPYRGASVCSSPTALPQPFPKISFFFWAERPMCAVLTKTSYGSTHPVTPLGAGRHFRAASRPVSIWG